MFAIDSTVTRKIQSIILEASVLDNNVEWFINGKFHGKGNKISFNLRKGEFQITAKQGNRVDKVKIIVVEK